MFCPKMYNTKLSILFLHFIALEPEKPWHTRVSTKKIHTYTWHRT